jgi:hypothetical protein
MTPDIGSPVWGFAVAVLPIILGIALVYAVVRWSRRPRTSQTHQVKERATERVYNEAERQERRQETS